MIIRYKPNFDKNEIKQLFSKKENIINEFEENFAKTVGSKYALTFPSARVGLFCLLKSLKLANNEIITPGYNCIVVPSAIISSKNTPVFVDISLNDFNIELGEISNVLSDNTKAIIPTHMYGSPVDILKIRDIVGDDVFIIEDAAQSILSKNVGKYGDAAFYSFNFEKQIFTFGGGVVTTNNDDVFEKLRNFKDKHFKNKNYLNDVKTFLLLSKTNIIFSDLFYEFFYKTWEKIGLKLWNKNNWGLSKKDLPVEQIYIKNDLNNHYSNFQAAAGISQLKKIKTDIEKRREIGKIYNEKLKGLKNITLPYFNPYSSFCHYTLRVKNRDHFEKFMKKRNIQINKVFEYAISDLPIFMPFIKKNQNMKNSLIASKENINLPIYPQLLNKKNKLRHIIKSILEYDDYFL